MCGGVQLLDTAGTPPSPAALISCFRCSTPFEARPRRGVPARSILVLLPFPSRFCLLSHNLLVPRFAASVWPCCVTGPCRGTTLRSVFALRCARAKSGRTSLSMTRRVAMRVADPAMGYRARGGTCTACAIGCEPSDIRACAVISCLLATPRPLCGTPVRACSSYLGGSALVQNCVSPIRVISDR